MSVVPLLQGPDPTSSGHLSAGQLYPMVCGLFSDSVKSNPRRAASEGPEVF